MKRIKKSQSWTAESPPSPLSHSSGRASRNFSRRLHPDIRSPEISCTIPRHPTPPTNSIPAHEVTADGLDAKGTVYVRGDEGEWHPCMGQQANNHGKDNQRSAASSTWGTFPQAGTTPSCRNGEAQEAQPPASLVIRISRSTSLAALIRMSYRISRSISLAALIRMPYRNLFPCSQWLLHTHVVFELMHVFVRQI